MESEGIVPGWRGGRARVKFRLQVPHASQGKDRQAAGPAPAGEQRAWRPSRHTGDSGVNQYGTQRRAHGGGGRARTRPAAARPALPLRLLSGEPESRPSPSPSPVLFKSRLSPSLLRVTIPSESRPSPSPVRAQVPGGGVPRRPQAALSESPGRPGPASRPPAHTGSAGGRPSRSQSRQSKPHLSAPPPGARGGGGASQARGPSPTGPGGVQWGVCIGRPVPGRERAGNGAGSGFPCHRPRAPPGRVSAGPAGPSRPPARRAHRPGKAGRGRPASRTRIAAALPGRAPLALGAPARGRRCRAR